MIAKHKMQSFLILLLIVALPSQSVGQEAASTDWPQWQGPNRDGVWTEKGTMDTFPEGGPKLVWKADVANGYAGPAVANGRVFIADFVRAEGDDTPNPGKKSELTGNERITCLDAKTGNQLWQYVYGCDYRLSYPNGPRVTPTVDGDNVYTLGAEGNLVCLSVENGKLVWKKDLKEAYGMKEAPHWGFSAHPLIDGDTLFCVVGGEGSVAVAFDKNTGEEKWKALSAKGPGYCPPTMIEAGGVKQLLIWHPESLNSLNPESGEVYWSFAMKPAYDMSIIAPIKHGDFLFATALQGTSILLKLDKNKPAANGSLARQRSSP